MKRVRRGIGQRAQLRQRPIKPAMTAVAMVALSALTLSAASPAYAQTCGSWMPDGPVGPRPRYAQTMAFDSQLGAAYLFGGQHRSGADLDDTWLIAMVGGAPSFLPLSAGPSGREWSGSAFDSGRGRMVLFGGEADGDALGDTWELVGGTWLLASESGPEPRSRPAMAYDAARGVTVLFGGYGTENFQDTWEWDGTVWTERATSGPPYDWYDSAMAYDPQHGYCVLLTDNQTWTWNGTTWTNKHAGLSVTRHAVCYDPSRQAVVAYSGGRLSQWTGSSWQTLGEGGPSAEWPSLYYDQNAQQLLLYRGDGGEFHLQRSELWGWDEAQAEWTRAWAWGPGTYAGFAMAYDAARAETVLFGGGNDSSDLCNETWAWDGEEWTQHETTVAPSPRRRHNMTYDAARNVVVLFGGYSGSNRNDTWEWDGTAWHQKFPTTVPSSRHSFAMAYDPVNQVVMMHGGYPGGSQGRSDTWAYDGDNWMLLEQGSAYAAYQHAMAFDERRGEMILHKGDGSYTYTFAWDAQQQRWQLRASNGPYGINQSMYYDPVQEVIVLTGHDGDLWEWDGESWLLRASDGPTQNCSDRCTAMVYDGLHQTAWLYNVWHADADMWRWDSGESIQFAEHPLDQTASVNDAVTLYVDVDGVGTLSFQWRRDGEDLNDGGHVFGALTDTLVLDPVSLADAGTYDVLVTDQCRSKLSLPALLAVVAAQPNLRPTEFDGPDAADAGSTILLQWSVVNDGGALANGPWADTAYLSEDDAWDPNDALLGVFTRPSSLLPGEDYTRNEYVEVPLGIDGPYYLILRVDSEEDVNETNENDNDAVHALTVNEFLPPDIAPVTDHTATEFEEYQFAPSLIQGSEPVTWALLAGPDSMEIDPEIGIVSWPAAVAAAEPYEITIEASNDAGSAQESWLLTVPPSYTAAVTASPAIVPLHDADGVTLSGSASWLADGTPAAGVDVTLHLRVRQTWRTLNVHTNGAGAFSLDWPPTPAGQYDVWATHPVVEPDPNASQANFVAVGLGATPSSLEHELLSDGTDAGSFVLRNLGDTTLTGISTAIVDLPTGITVEVTSAPTELGPLAEGVAEYSISAGPDTVPWSDAQIELASSEGALVMVDLRLRVAPPTPELAADPGTLTGTMVLGTQRNVSFTVTNTGSASTAPLSLSIPGEPWWMSIATPNPLPALEPGEQALVTVLLTPESHDPNVPPPGLGMHTGSIVVAGEQTGVVVPFEILCVSDGQGDLRVVAQDDFSHFDPNVPGLAGAAVRVVDAYSGTEVATGTTDSNGEISFADLTEAYYRVEVTAPEHGGFRTTLRLPAGEETQIDAFLPVDFVSYSWSVEEDVIPDHYTFTIEADFMVNVPFPVLEVQPMLLDLRDLLDPNESIVVDYTITNHGLINAEDVQFVLGTHPRYTFTPAVEDIGTIAPQTTITVPVVIEDHGGCYCQRNVTAYVSWGVYDMPDYRRRTNIYYILEHGCCPLPEDPGDNGAPSGGGGDGDGGWGGGGDPYTPPDEFEDEIEGVDAVVTIAISQDMVLGRDAFTARLELTNHHELLPLDDTGVDIQLLDVQNADANALFGIHPPEVTGMTAVDGTGVLLPLTSGAATWTIVPTVDAAPNEATRYYVAGHLSFSVDGVDYDIPLYPVPITVLPVPSLEVRYFLERFVQSDSPWTDEVEPAVPCALGLMVTNNGGGVARDMQVASAQPEIIDNPYGLLIEFDIIGSRVGTQDVTPSLTVSLGDVTPAETVVAQWLMTTTLQGEFIRYEASYEHLDGLGNPRLSLIESLDIHPTLHAVRSDYPDDELPDFLTYVVEDPNEPLDPNALPEKLYLSDGSSPVDVVTVLNATTDGPLTEADPIVELTVPGMPAGWTYIRTANPGAAGFALVSATRQDGQPVRVPDNAWTTHWIVKETGEDPYAIDQLHLFDLGGPGVYTLEFGAAPPAAPMITDITSATAVLTDLDSPGPATREHAVQDTESGLFVGPDGRLQTDPYWQPRNAWPGIMIRALDAATTHRFAARARLAGGQESTLSAATEVTTTRAGDTNGDDAVTFADVGVVRRALGTQYGNPEFDARADLNGDDRVTYADLGIVRRNLGPGKPAPDGTAVRRP